MKTFTRILQVAVLMMLTSAISFAQLSLSESSNVQYSINPTIDITTLDVDHNAVPTYVKPTSTKGMWDIQFAYQLATITGATGIAGAECSGTHFYAAQWGSTANVRKIYKLSLTGALVDSINPTWVTTSTSGIRDMAWDGTYLYGSDVTTTIYCFSQTGQLINTITSPVAVRAIAYDNGNDAFWVNNFATTLTLVSRAGATLNTITTPPSMYGCAYDSIFPGGPYLWIFTGTSTGGGCQIQQYKISTKTLTPFTHSVSGDFGASAIAGGLFVEPNIVPGKLTVGGCAQSTLTLFGYEIGSSAAALPNDLGVVAVSEPLSGMLTNAEQVKISVFNYGSLPQSSFSVSYQINSGAVVTENITNAMIPGGTFNYTFTQTADLSTAGATFILKAWTTLAADTNSGNDTVVKTITNTITTTPWGILFQYPAASVTGAIGLAGAVWNNSHFFVAEWGSSGNRKIYKMNKNGTVAGNYTPTWIPGTGGLRDLTFDGTYMYGSDASTTIYCFDGNGLLINTITSPVVVRAIAHDPVSDAFWVNNFSTDLTLVSRQGVILNVIPTPPSCYGMAYDGITAGGPYLWLFTGTTSGLGSQVEQLKISTGTLTGVTHSVSGDFGTGTDIAGGLFSSSTIVPNSFVLGGLIQGAQILFGYFLDLVVGTNDATLPADLNLRIYPNPASESFAVNSSFDMQYIIIYNQGGQVVYTEEPNAKTARIDVSTFARGIYFVQVQTLNGIQSQKISLR